MNVVGAKGQVVIERQLREKLGVEPGWLTVQRLVDGHVEIFFVPPEHGRSLKGVLGPPPARDVPTADWDSVKEAAWEEAAHQKMSPEPRD